MAYHRVNDCPDYRGTPLSHRTPRWMVRIGSENLLVWAWSCDAAIDECVDWAAEHAPGLLCDSEVAEEFERLVAENIPTDDAMELATVDTTCAGNEGHYVRSDDWSLLENPDRATLLQLQGRV